ncbi:MAG: hypothetical protein M1832_006252 [Thelocarpon impressellum]|nr:MAG: hypothetical protein M1832_006252 [Thelocarpon impressellum]
MANGAESDRELVVPNSVTDIEVRDQSPQEEIRHSANRHGKGRKRLVPTLLPGFELPNQQPETSSPSRLLEVPTRSASPVESVGQARPMDPPPTDDGASTLEPSTFPYSPAKSGPRNTRKEAITRAKIIKRQEERAGDESKLYKGYLGEHSLPVDEIFYDKVSFGEEVRNEVRYAKPSGTPFPDLEDNFVIDSADRISSGRRLYVHQLLKYYLLRSRRELFASNGRTFSGVQPYPSRVGRKHQSTSFTLFSAFEGAKVKATREDVAMWPDFPSDLGPASGQPDLADDNYSQLALHDGEDPLLKDLEKYRFMENVTTIPAAFGESGSEGEYDSDTWREIEQERGQIVKPLGKSTRRPLSADEVSVAIELGTSDLVDKWTRQKLPKREATAWSIWRKSRRERKERLQIREASVRVDQINNERLPKMRKEIAAEVWTTSLQVRKQCKIMEQSIFDREDMLWKIKILKLKATPPRPPPRMRARKETPRPILHESEEGEYDVIDSDSDRLRECSDEDEFDGFLVGDNTTDGANGTDGEFSALEADQEDAMDIDDDITVDGEGKAKDDQISTSGTLRERSASPASSLLSSVRTPSEPVEVRRGTAEFSDRLRKIQPMVVDLTMTSDSSGPEKGPGSRIRTPPGSRPDSDNPLRAPVMGTGTGKARVKRPLNHPVKVIVMGGSISGADNDASAVGKAPDEEDSESYSDAKAIDLKSYEFYEKKGDRKGLLVKIVYHMTPKKRDEIISRVSLVKELDIRFETWDALDCIRDDRQNLAGMDKGTFEYVSRFARLYLMWHECLRRKLELGWPKAAIHRARKNRAEFHRFFIFLRKILEKYDDAMSDGERASGRRGTRSGNAVLRTDESKDLVSPSRRRKRRVIENEQARTLRNDDRERVRNEMKRRRELASRLQGMGQSMTGDASHIIVNTGKFDDQDFVYINPHIGMRIKPHQVEGVRFMWRELVMDEKSLQGCLLAHTMGLGKTLQIITLLVTIAEAARSKNPKVSAQVPPSLRLSRTLILCPPTLIDNWWDEFLMWAPSQLDESVGQLRKVDSLLLKPEVRLREITAWHEQGGIMILSYDLFRNLVLNKARTDRAPTLSQQQHSAAKEMLLQGPNIIVADEAHKMKNAQSAIALVASQFRSKSRIALTGSPIANNLEEYHSMIDWIAPGYLGPSTEFRAKYVEPIQEGLYLESTREEQRRSAIKLRVLKKDLDPKVHRADISVLKGSLGPKTEFVIKVPLTKIQEEAYRLYVQTMLSGTGEVGNTRVWDWLAILSLLCNHPICFRDKLVAREESSQKASPNPKATQSSIVNSKADEDTAETVPGDAPISKLGFSKVLVDNQLALLAKSDGPLDAMHHSYKVQIFDQILTAAIRAGDKTLVFSHSLPTLDYLESLFTHTKRRYCRLTGDTKMTERQKNTKDFNLGNFDVYLISTRAGGLGLNLYGANRVIIFDFAFNPTWEEQAVGRAYRIGQTKPVFVYRFTAGGTFEDVVHNRAIFKMQLASRVVDKKNPMRYAQRKVRDLLFEPREVEQKDLAEFKGKDPQVLDGILEGQQNEASIRSIELTETFHRDDEDALTAEDEKEADRLLRDNQLQRSDPRAYTRMMDDRMMEMQARTSNLAVAAANAALARPGPLPGSQPTPPQRRETPVYPPVHVPQPQTQPALPAAQPGQAPAKKTARQTPVYPPGHVPSPQRATPSPPRASSNSKRTVSVRGSKSRLTAVPILSRPTEDSARAQSGV